MNIEQVVVSVLCGGGGVALINYLLNLRKNKAESKGSELDNLEKAIKIWRDLTHELEEEVKKLRQEIETIKNEFKEQCDNCQYKKSYNSGKAG